MQTLMEVLLEVSSKTQTKITYKDLADVLGCSRQWISQIKNDELSQAQCEKIENYYNIKLVDSNLIKDSHIILDYYPNIFGTVKNNVFTFATKKEQVVIPKNAFSVDFSETSKYCVIKANNSGMEPYIYPQDKLIIKHHANEQIIDNNVYIFSYKDEIFIRRLVKNINQLILISENKEYDNIKIEKNDLSSVKIIGLVIGLLRNTI